MDNELENASKLFNSSVGIALGFGISGLLSVLTRIALARILEPSGYGILSEALAIMTFLVTFSILGMSSGVTRFISYEDEDSRPLGAGLVVVAPLSLFGGLLLYLLAGPVAAFMGSAVLEPTLKVFAFNIPALSVLSLLVAGFRGHKRTLEPVIIRDVLIPSVILVGGVALALVAPYPYYAAVGYTAAGWVGLFIGMAAYYRKHSIELPSRPDIDELLYFSAPIWVSNLFKLGITWINILLLGYLLDSSMAGLYNAAFPISFAITFGLTSISFLVMPLMSTLHSKNRTGEMKSLYTTIERWLMVSTLPVFLVLVLRSSFLVDLVFGPDYAPAAALLVVLSAGRFVSVIFGPVGQMLIAFGETEWEAVSRGTGFLVILATSLFLIPGYGLLGAGASYLVGLTVTNSVRLWRTRKHGDFNPLSADYAKPLAAAAVASTVLLGLRGDTIVELASIAIFLALYAALLLASRPLKEEDIHSIEQMMERVPSENTDKIVGWLRKFQE